MCPINHSAVSDPYLKAFTTNRRQFSENHFGDFLLIHLTCACRWKRGRPPGTQKICSGSLGPLGAPLSCPLKYMREREREREQTHRVERGSFLLTGPGTWPGRPWAPVSTVCPVLPGTGGQGPSCSGLSLVFSTPHDHDQLAVGHPGVFSRGIPEVLHEGDGLAHILNDCGRGQASRSQRSRVAVERPGCN